MILLGPSEGTFPYTYHQGLVLSGIGASLIEERGWGFEFHCVQCACVVGHL